MSDQELRGVLAEIIRDIDEGRVRVPRARGRVAAVIGPPLLALGLGLSGGACSDRPVGVEADAGAPTDARVSRDSVAQAQDAEPQPLDAGSVLMYGPPFPLQDAEVDSGPQVAYGQPFPELDAGSMEDYGVPPTEPDGGPYDLYGVPFAPDGDGDPAAQGR